MAAHEWAGSACDSPGTDATVDQLLREQSPGAIQPPQHGIHHRKCKHLSAVHRAQEQSPHAGFLRGSASLHHDQLPGSQRDPHIAEPSPGLESQHASNDRNSNPELGAAVIVPVPGAQDPHPDAQGRPGCSVIYMDLYAKQ